MRFNFACPRARIEEAVTRLATAFREFRYRVDAIALLLPSQQTVFARAADAASPSRPSAA